MAHLSKPRRQVRVCQRCRNLKVRCDTRRPTCTRCVKADIYCIFSSDAAVSENSNTDPLPIGDTEPIEATSGSATEGLVLDGKRNRLPISCARCRQLKVRCDRNHPCARCKRGEAACSYIQPDGSTPKQYLGPPFSAAARVAEWRGKFRSDVHWIRLVKEVEESLRVNGVAAAHYDHLVPPEQPRPIVDYPFGQQSSQPRTVLLTYLPSRGVADILMHRYLETIEKTHHFLHIPTFEDEVSRFWQQPLEAEDSWLAMFAALLYLGCEVSNVVTNDADETMNVTSTQLVEASRGFLHRTSFMVYPSLHTIRTLCMIVVAKQTSHMSCDSIDSAWCLTGIRRVLWMTVNYLDMRQSLLIGMSLFSSPRMLTVSAPVNIKFKGIRSLTTEMPVALDELHRTESTFHVLLADAFPVASRLVELSHNPDQADAYDVAVHVTTDAKVLLKRAAGLLRQTIPGDSTRNALCSEDLEAIMFDILFRGLLLSAHRSFARDELAVFQYPVSYWTSLDCALAILVHQRDLWEVRNKNLALTRLFWPDFLSAALTLSSYLLQGDALLDPPGCCAAHARVALREALHSCRDIWLLAKDKNVCHSKAFSLIDRVMSALTDGPDH
ncbi:hypothetical protein BDW59DRAFT_171085 [Aspergillus cavernicola]|uniref:Zn(2)-C6 fungal-type domain-containing protein n=1 Tax=Aspergillus cavernicola TaxID=176166 RepID=A0ABR4IJI6_9EURO